MGYDLLSTKWASPAEVRYWKESVNPILAGLSLSVCIIAQIIYYIFPRLRVFPRSIISWVNVYNMIHMSYVFTKWWPHSALHEGWVTNLKTGSILCGLSTFLDNNDTFGALCCTLLLCLTMFLRIVMRIDIEGRRAYHVSYLAFAVGFPVSMGIIFTFGFGKDEVNLNCVVDPTGQLFLRVIYCIIFFTQMVLFIITMFYIRRAFSTVAHATNNNFPMSYLVIRFSALFFFQQYSLLPGQAVQMFQGTSGNAIFTRFVSVSRLNGVMLEAFVLIFGNADFVDWVKKQYTTRFKQLNSYNTQESNTPDIEMARRSSNNPKVVDELEIQVDEEVLQLSTSAEKMGMSEPKHLSHSLGKTTTTSSEEQTTSSDMAEGVHSDALNSNEIQE